MLKPCACAWACACACMLRSRNRALVPVPRHTPVPSPPQATGTAQYTEDVPVHKGALYGAYVMGAKAGAVLEVRGAVRVVPRCHGSWRGS